ncbi:hypothetical protein ILUMI_19836 [Ignelater luminosus]|uniref:Large ribosomal subunit protein uL10 n=1 Tax=Ignelater luminosus TaxID=2038154 RepID=A0A8K0CJD4_IGNLU|nr:hypothetical protein ILUMI_19836 [Ignelater luminosus]
MKTEEHHHDITRRFLAPDCYSCSKHWFGTRKTPFFQAHFIPAKISRIPLTLSTIYVHILKPGDKVGASEATLLNVWNIPPFSYGLLVEQVYDSVGVANLASVCLSIGYPTVTSAQYSIANGFKNILAIAAITEVEFKEVI